MDLKTIFSEVNENKKLELLFRGEENNSIGTATAYSAFNFSITSTSDTLNAKLKSRAVDSKVTHLYCCILSHQCMKVYSTLEVVGGSLSLGYLFSHHLLSLSQRIVTWEIRLSDTQDISSLEASTSSYQIRRRQA